MEARKVTFTAKPGTFRDAVRAYKKYKEEKEQRLKYTAALGPKGRFACKEPTRCVFKALL